MACCYTSTFSKCNSLICFLMPWNSGNAYLACLLEKKSMAACLETFELKTNAALVFRSDLTTFSHYLTMSTVPQSTSPSLELCNKPRSHAACHISIGHGTGDLKGMSQGWVHLNSKSNSMTISYQYIYIYHIILNMICDRLASFNWYSS